MRTVVNLFPRLCDPGHLDEAADDTVRGKRRSLSSRAGGLLF